MYSCAISGIPEDDTNVVPIAVGVSIGGFVVIVTIAVIVAVVAIRKRMMYEKYVLPYRSYVKPYTVYGKEYEVMHFIQIYVARFSDHV